MRNFIALWCNGSTTDFGSVRAGSNPTRVTYCFMLSNRYYFIHS